MPGAWHEDSEESRRWSLPGKPCTFSPLGQGFLVLEGSELIKRVGEVAGLLLSHSWRRGRALRGWPPSWLAAAQRPTGQAPHAPGSGRRRCTPGGPSWSEPAAPPPGMRP